VSSFLQRLGAFLAVFGVVLGLVSVANLSFRSFLVAGDDMLGAELRVIVLGDSHTETAIDPTLIEGSRNVSQTSEHYLYTYYKLRHLLADNQHIEHVVLGFSYHNLSDAMDKALFDPSLSGKMFARYFLLLDLPALRTLSQPTNSYVINALKHVFGVPFQLERNALASALRGKRVRLPFWGEFYRRDASNLADEVFDDAINRHYTYPDGAQRALSPLQAEYLDKIMDLCREHGVELTLISPPLHPRYRARVPAAFATAYGRVARQVANPDDGVRLLDLSAIELDEGSYGDPDHVNVRGAEVVSARLGASLD
jgi:hypothetical protein